MAILSAVCLLIGVTATPDVTAGALKPTPLGALAAESIGSAPAIPVGSQDLGPVNGSGDVSFDLVLRPRSAEALQAFAEAVSTPGSAAYGDFLDTAQFASRFGETPATIRAIDVDLRADGLTPGTVSPNDLVIPVTATVRAAEVGLHTGFEQYRLGNGRLATANTQAPQLPVSVAPSVQAVIGLNSLATPDAAPPTAAASRITTSSLNRPAAVPTTSGPTPCAAAISAGSATSSWTENQLAQAYSFTGLYKKGQLGAKTTIALFELDPFAASDIAAFQSCYKTRVPITTINVSGGAGSGSGEGESTLDIETIIGLAPKSSLLVYEAPISNYARSTIDDYTKIITDNKAQIISSSFGLCEPLVNALAPGLAASENTLFEEAATQGISTFVASGDTGSAECYSNGGVDSLSLGSSSKPGAVAVDPTYHTAYVTDLGTGRLSVVNDSTQALVKTISFGSGSDPSSVTVDTTTHKVFIGLSGSEQVAELSSSKCNATTVSACTTTLLKVGTSANDVEGVTANPATGTVYAALEGEGKVATIKESGLSLTAKISSGGSDPYGIAVNTATNTVYVTNVVSDTVARINGATCDAAVTSGCSQKPPVTGVGAGPVSVAVDNSAHQFFVVNFDDSSLSILSTTTGALEQEASLSAYTTGPADIALSPDGNHLLIPANFVGFAALKPGILVVQISNDTITGSLNDTGHQPFAVASDPANDVVTEADPKDGDAVFLPLGLAVDDPSSQPWVTSVGGTDLTSLGPKPTETTWNEAFNGTCDCQEGSGTGGISINWRIPSWQKGPGVINPHSSGVPCKASTGDCREVPDVAASADPVHGYVIFHAGTWGSVGGTSAATPLWASLVAVVESEHASPVREGFLDPRLYSTAASHGSEVFNDVTHGTNDYVGIHNGLYGATANYDMATGLGSPVGTGLESLLPAPA